MRIVDSRGRPSDAPFLEADLREFLIETRFPAAAAAITLRLLDAASVDEPELWDCTNQPLLPLLLVGNTGVLGPLRLHDDDPCSLCVLRHIPEAGRYYEKSYAIAATSSALLAQYIAPLVRAIAGSRFAPADTFIIDGATLNALRYIVQHRHPLCPMHTPHAAIVALNDTTSIPLEARMFDVPSVVRGAARNGYGAIVRDIQRVVFEPSNPLRDVCNDFYTYAAWRRRAIDSSHEVVFASDTRREVAVSKLVMEGYERWSLEAAIGEAFVEGSYQDLGAERACDPSIFHTYAAWQVEADWFSYRQYSADAALRWLPSVDLATGRSRLVPIDFVVNWWMPAWPPPLCQLNSIGAAARESFNLSAVTALLEVIERHCIMSWWCGLTAAEEVTIDGALGASRGLPKSHRLRIFNVSVLPNLWVFVAVFESATERPYAAFGAGASSCKNDAVSTATREAAVNLAAGAELGSASARADVHMTPQDHARYYANGRSWQAVQQYMRIAAPTAAHRAVTSPFDDSPFDLPKLRATLVAAGFRDLMLVNVAPATLQRLGVHAVRAVVPGLLPMAFGSSQQRLANVEDLLAPDHLAMVRTLPVPFA